MFNNKVCYIISDIDRSVAFEWLFEELVKKFDLKVILLNPGKTKFEDYLHQNNISYAAIVCTGKKDWLAAIWKIYSLLKKWKPCAVHCHLVQATIIGLGAAKLAGIQNRIYTRHHSSEHHVYHPKGVLIDKVSNRLATRIVAISTSVRGILQDKEKVPPGKIVDIPHGLRLDLFQNISHERIKVIKRKYNLENSFPVIGVISRFVDWKGIQYIIPAFIKVLQEHPESILILLNAVGPYEAQLKLMMASIPEANKRLVFFEEDIPAVYQCMDVFVHVPVNEHCEAFGQIYVEALAAGVPSVVTLSGIAPDFIENEYNALVVGYNNEQEITRSINQIIEDGQLKHKLKQNGPASVAYYNFNRFVSDLTTLYHSVGCLQK